MLQNGCCTCTRLAATRRCSSDESIRPFFFFFFEFTPTCANSSWYRLIRTDSNQNRPKFTKFGWNWPKLAEIGQNHGQNSDISFCFHLFLACTNRLTITIICSIGHAKIIIAIYANRLWGVASTQHFGPKSCK